jgi:nanoRNase/pAp phosphatase (c-di-AMP/oligoRNAs hydrolase)
VREGKLLLKQTRRRVKRQARMSVRVPALPGAYEHPVLLANAPVLTSETCHKLLQSGGAQVAIAWWIARDAVSMSLRSTLKADVSVLSRRLGEIHPGFVSGGGHPQAAGARFGRAEGLALVTSWLATATDWKF